MPVFGAGWPESSSSALMAWWRSGRRRCGGRRARGSRTSSTRAPREREEASGVGLVLDLRRNRPVHGEPQARRRRRDWEAAIGWVLVGFGARMSFTGVGRGC